MKISLILPHQLFYPNPVLSRSRTVFILEDPIFLNDKEYPTRFHKQKIMLHLLSIKCYSIRGFVIRATFVKPDPDNSPSTLITLP